MTVKIVQELYCDRCKEKFTRSRARDYGDTYTMEIGWFLLNNGSGSKLSTHDRSRDNLDYDLCEDCTEGFRNWWKNASGVKINA